MGRSAADTRPVVLVVEDEILIRMNTVDIFEELGFDVVEAGSADEAIIILESRNDIRVLFTDIDMPGSMDGLKLASAVADRWPPIRVIVTSGHVRVRIDEMPSTGVFMGKPYTAKQIRSELSEFCAP